jgi:hypothetical protein
MEQYISSTQRIWLVTGDPKLIYWLCDPKLIFGCDPIIFELGPWPVNKYIPLLFFPQRIESGNRQRKMPASSPATTDYRYQDSPTCMARRKGGQHRIILCGRRPQLTTSTSPTNLISFFVFCFERYQPHTPDLPATAGRSNLGCTKDAALSIPNHKAFQESWQDWSNLYNKIIIFMTPIKYH